MNVHSPTTSEFKESPAPEIFIFDDRFFLPSADVNHIACNSKFFSVAHVNGLVSLLRLDAFGHHGTESPKLQPDRVSKVTDIAWSPFKLNILATSLQNSMIKIWRIPPERGLVGRTRPTRKHLQLLEGHSKRVNKIVFHPTVNDVLTSLSNDRSVRIWDIPRAETRARVNFPAIPLHVDFDAMGSVMSVIARDKTLRIIDIRCASETERIVASVERAHLSMQALRVLYCRNKEGMLISSGFASGGIRDVAMWDLRNLSSGRLHSLRVGGSSGSLIPFYDEDLSLFYVFGKGEGQARYFDVTRESHKFHPIGSFSSPHPQKGVCMLPKLCLNTCDHEIARFYKVVEVDRHCTVVKSRVLFPRKTIFFQEDLFPDSNSFVSKNQPDDLFGETEEGLVPLEKISLNPESRPEGFGEQKITITRQHLVKKAIDAPPEQTVDDWGKPKLVRTIKELQEALVVKNEAIFSLKQKREGDAVVRDFLECKLKQIIAGDESLGDVIRMEEIDAAAVQVERDKLLQQSKELELHFQSQLSAKDREIRQLKNRVRRFGEKLARWQKGDVREAHDDHVDHVGDTLVEEIHQANEELSAKLKEKGHEIEVMQLEHKDRQRELSFSIVSLRREVEKLRMSAQEQEGESRAHSASRKSEEQELAKLRLMVTDLSAAKVDLMHRIRDLTNQNEHFETEVAELIADGERKDLQIAEFIARDSFASRRHHRVSASLGAGMSMVRDNAMLKKKCEELEAKIFGLSDSVMKLTSTFRKKEKFLKSLIPKDTETVIERIPESDPAAPASHPHAGEVDLPEAIRQMRVEELEAEVEKLRREGQAKIEELEQVNQERTQELVDRVKELEASLAEKDGDADEREEASSLAESEKDGEDEKPEASLDGGGENREALGEDSGDY